MIQTKTNSTGEDSARRSPRAGTKARPPHDLLAAPHAVSVDEVTKKLRTDSHRAWDMPALQRASYTCKNSPLSRSRDAFSLTRNDALGQSVPDAAACGECFHGPPVAAVPVVSGGVGPPKDAFCCCR